ncbi:Hypothetical protein FKW44_013288, partial [Caligus rogercresseyi]
LVELVVFVNFLLIIMLTFIAITNFLNIIHDNILHLQLTSFKTKKITRGKSRGGMKKFIGLERGAQA